MSVVVAVQGGEVEVDADAQPLMAPYKWRIRPFRTGKAPYADAWVCGRREMLHRFLWASWGLPAGSLIDHINRNGLDCRRENLRAATASQNSANRRVISASGFKGVTFHRRVGKWQAAICVRGKSKYLGVFDDPRVAANAYDSAAREAFGEFAFLNEATP